MEELMIRKGDLGSRTALNHVKGKRSQTLVKVIRINHGNGQRVEHELN